MSTNSIEIKADVLRKCVSIAGRALPNRPVSLFDNAVLISFEPDGQFIEVTGTDCSRCSVSSSGARVGHLQESLILPFKALDSYLSAVKGNLTVNLVNNDDSALLQVIDYRVNSKGDKIVKVISQIKLPTLSTEMGSFPERNKQNMEIVCNVLGSTLKQSLDTCISASGKRDNGGDRFIGLVRLAYGCSEIDGGLEKGSFEIAGTDSIKIARTIHNQKPPIGHKELPFSAVCSSDDLVKLSPLWGIEEPVSVYIDSTMDDGIVNTRGVGFKWQDGEITAEYWIPAHDKSFPNLGKHLDLRSGQTVVVDITTLSQAISRAGVSIELDKSTENGKTKFSIHPDTEGNEDLLIIHSPAGEERVPCRVIGRVQGEHEFDSPENFSLSSTHLSTILRSCPDKEIAILERGKYTGRAGLHPMPICFLKGSAIKEDGSIDKKASMEWRMLQAPMADK